MLATLLPRDALLEGTLRPREPPRLPLSSLRWGGGQPGGAKWWCKVGGVWWCRLGQGL